MSTPQTAEEAYRRGAFGGAQRTGRRPCLVVVDLNLGFTDPASPLSCATDPAVEAVRDLLAAARSAGNPVVYTTIEYDDAAERTAHAFVAKSPNLLLLRPGSRWTRIDSRIAPRPGEPVLTKLFASAFFGTHLNALLTAERCDSVVVVGASTSGCVRATAVDALQHGYSVVVPRDGVADRATDAHQGSLRDLQAKYADVVDLPTALALLGRSPTT
ncbi:isochorismatase family protein [Micromonospora yangpuensis]|uniref:Nicotinamidase-related amidase n=1 Tax=Micromonospora yangpuensis TaxID=683228 RepID=A0A1C6UVR8_9ACTN|nr:isochorismatase family protein [Micromonospora yangpuensis]GGM25779.1 N-carbamoylsarcosine amidase [Micromonospora yangpuensis]SCL58152.1 Nicotinamidase-related amidase [Micromonospora yangpuensis]